MTMQGLKVVIPMAGLGSRLRPLTWSRPKQLLRVADKPLLEHVMDMFQTLPDPQQAEYIFIVGHRGERVEAYMHQHHPNLRVRFFYQHQPRGQSHAIYQAREVLGGSMLLVFPDTLVDADFSILPREIDDAVAWVRVVDDPRRFGVAVVGEDGLVTRLIEKPQDKRHPLAVVGFYFFRRSEDLLAAIEEQMAHDVQLKGEYFVADAVNIMLQRGLAMRTQPVTTWFDAGTPQSLLATNRHLLEHGHDNSAEAAQRPGVIVKPPVYIHPDAQVTDSVIGPHVALGSGCQVRGCVMRDSIVEDGAQVTEVILERSLVGERAYLRGRASIIKTGDDSRLIF